MGALATGILFASLIAMPVEVALCNDQVRAGRDLGLTAKEFELLEYFLRHAGEVVSREMLAAAVWQEPLRHSAVDNVIDVQIGRLRRKLDEPFDSRLLHTIRGVGFVLREEI